MKDLTVKFRSGHDTIHRSKTTIWQTPEGSLYRVIQRSNDFEISTLVTIGWIPLLHLHKNEDSVPDRGEAGEPLATHQEPCSGRVPDQNMTAPADPRLALDDALDLRVDEIEQLRRLCTRLMDLQACRAAAASA
ncbi:hypothetical protein [Streptomyces sp. NPDC093149]|uniref:hypothetical protein n=1 Tax=Streptomyces sp. NPDC093149 TaxID=3366031 RepID=UPI00381305CA